MKKDSMIHHYQRHVAEGKFEIKKPLKQLELFPNPGDAHELNRWENQEATRAGWKELWRNVRWYRSMGFWMEPAYDKEWNCFYMVEISNDFRRRTKDCALRP